ncbi:MAG: GNAT family N-acetyltransferase [Hyphomicrobiaceae bacterium]
MAGGGGSAAVATGVALHRDGLIGVERAAVRAWPAGETRRVDGWLWRYSGGGSQRANSVSALNYEGTDVERTIDAVEALYRECGAPVRFQVGFPLSQPENLDERLAARGYEIHDPVTTLLKPVEAVAAVADVVLRDAPSEGWLSVYLANVTPDRRPFATAILARVPEPRVFAEVVRDGAVIATALGVFCEDTVIAECVGTASAARRRGAAAAVMRALEAWGARLGAHTIGLQAVTTNVPAQGLYAALGYVPAGTYHYRFLEAGSSR